MSKCVAALAVSVILVVFFVGQSESKPSELAELHTHALDENAMGVTVKELTRVKRQKMVRVKKPQRKRGRRKRKKSKKRKKKKVGLRPPIMPPGMPATEAPMETTVPIDTTMPMDTTMSMDMPEQPEKMAPESGPESWPEPENGSEEPEPDSNEEEPSENNEEEQEPEESEEKPEEDSVQECDHKAMATELFEKAKSNAMAGAMGPPNPMAMMAAGNDAKAMWDSAKQACFEQFRNKFGGGGVPMPVPVMGAMGGMMGRR